MQLVETNTSYTQTQSKIICFKQIPNQDAIAAFAEDGYVYILNAHTLECTGGADLEHGGIQTVCPMSDGFYLVTETSQYVAWDPAKAEIVTYDHGPAVPITSSVIFQDALVVGHESGMVTSSDASPAQRSNPLVLPGAIRSLREDGRFLVAVTDYQIFLLTKKNGVLKIHAKSEIRDDGGKWLYACTDKDFVYAAGTIGKPDTNPRTGATCMYPFNRMALMKNNLIATPIPEMPSECDLLLETAEFATCFEPVGQLVALGVSNGLILFDAAFMTPVVGIELLDTHPTAVCKTKSGLLIALSDGSVQVYTLEDDKLSTRTTKQGGPMSLLKESQPPFDFQLEPIHTIVKVGTDPISKVA